MPKIDFQGYELTQYQQALLNAVADKNVDVINGILYEARRQSTNVEGVLNLAQAYAQAKRTAETQRIPRRETVLGIATITEPKNNHMVRRINVTFGYGGGAASGSSAPEAFGSFCEQLQRLNDDDLKDIGLIDEVVKSFLSIHPFLDGNGRTAWILRVWLTNTWEKPERLPYYNFS